MHRKLFCVLTIVCCTVFYTNPVFFSNLSGSEDGDVWVAQDGESERCFVAEECYIHPAEKRILAFEQVGMIDFIHVKEGDSIKPDEIVGGLRAKIAEKELAAAELKAANTTDIRYSKKSQEVAKTEFEKAKLVNARSKGARSKLELDRLKLEWDKSILQIEQSEDKKTIAEYELEQAKARLSSFHITGRIDGVVTRIFKKPGEAVRQGDPVMEVKDTRRVKIEGSLPFTDAVHVKHGALVIATLELKSEDARKFAGSGKEYRGTVIFVDTKVNRNKPIISFKAEFDNSEGRLIPGLQATLKVYPDKQGPEVPRKKKPAITSIQD